MRRLCVVVLLLLLVLTPSLVSAESAGDVRSARVTAYAWTGNVMYSGVYPQDGDVACSWDIALGSTVTILDGPLAGSSYVCEDRGLLGSGYPESWIDIYAGTTDNAWALMALYPDQQMLIAVASP